MDVLYVLLGLFIIYVSVHFFVIQFTTSWKLRTPYEKFLTIATIIFTILVYFGE